MQTRQLAMIVGVVAVVAVAAGGILFFLRRGKGDETTTSAPATQTAQRPPGTPPAATPPGAQVANPPAGTQPTAPGGALPPAGGAASAPRPTGAQMGAGGAPAKPAGQPGGALPPAGGAATPGAGAPGAAGTKLATAAGASTALPNRPDPFLPYDWVPPPLRKVIPPTILDFGFPVAERGPDPERQTADQPRVAAIAWDYQGKVFATIELEGQTYVVEPGDFVGTDIRVVSIDRTHNTVTLRKDNALVELTLMPRAVTPGKP